MKKNVRTASSTKIAEVPAIVIGVATASIISILLIAGMTSLVMNGTIGESMLDLYIFFARTIGAMFGCLVATLLMKGKYLVIALATAFAYLAILVAMGIVLYDGSFNNILSGVASTLLGGAIACMIVLKPLKKSKQTVRYRR